MVTQNVAPLTKKQIQSFRSNGYVLIPGFFDDQTVDDFRRIADEIEKMPRAVWNPEEGKWDYRGAVIHNLDPSRFLIAEPEKDNPAQLCRVEDMLSCHKGLAPLVASQVTPMVSGLAGVPYALFKDKLNFKRPGGGAFTPHQDFPAYSLFGPRSHITAMITIDPSTVENGCLQFPKNYLQALEDHPKLDRIQLATGRPILPYDQNGDVHPDIVSCLDWEYVPTNPSDLVLFDSYVPHCSEANNSSKPRRAMFITHNAAHEGENQHATYYIQKRRDPSNPLFHWGTPTRVRKEVRED